MKEVEGERKRCSQRRSPGLTAPCVSMNISKSFSLNKHAGPRRLRSPTINITCLQKNRHTRRSQVSGQRVIEFHHLTGRAPFHATPAAGQRVLPCALTIIPLKRARGSSQTEGEPNAGDFHALVEACEDSDGGFAEWEEILFPRVISAPETQRLRASRAASCTVFPDSLHAWLHATAAWSHQVSSYFYSSTLWYCYFEYSFYYVSGTLLCRFRFYRQRQ